MSPKSEAGRQDRQAGFILIDLIATMSIVALLLTLVLPNLIFSTTPLQMHLLVAGTASMLRNTRTTALAENTDVLTSFDALHRIVRSGRDVITVPKDVDLSVVSGGDCHSEDGVVEIVFHRDGTNCGAVFRFETGREIYKLRVNWATGGIDVLRN